MALVQPAYPRVPPGVKVRLGLYFCPAMQLRSEVSWRGKGERTRNARSLVDLRKLVSETEVNAARNRTGSMRGRPQKNARLETYQSLERNLANTLAESGNPDAAAM